METSFGVDGSTLKLRYSGLRKASARVSTRCSAGLAVFGGGSAATPAPAASPASIATAQRLHPKSRKSLRCHATVLPNGEADRRRTLMLKYVNECDPNEVQTFVDSAPPAVVSAMRHTVSNIVGSLPSAYFEVKVSTVADSLAQLFYTMAMTGYLFSSAQYRMELISSLNGGIAAPGSTTAPELATTAGPVSLSTSPSSSGGSSSDDDASMSLVRSDSGSSASSSSSLSVMVLPDEAQYAPGVQKRDIQGQVLRWHNENGLEKMEAAEYMEHLEHQVVVLKEALAQQQQQRAGAWQERPLQGWPEMGVGSSGRGSATVTAAATAAAAASSPKVQFPSPATAGTSAAAAAAAAAAAGGSGELLDFLRSLPGDSLGELTSNACPEVLDAMDAFVSRLMGTSDKEQLRSMSSEFSATELSKVLIWLLVVGYALRTAEMRLEALSFRGDKPGGQGGGTGGVLGLGGFGKSGPKNGGFGGWARFLPGR